MALDIEKLVAPLSDDAPSGPDLCYEDGRVEIEKVFDRSVSDEVAEERSEKEWRDASKLILKEAKDTRDIWLPVYLMRAGASAGDFNQVVEGAEFLARLLEERWADVHPQLDEYGFIGRKTPCESLVRKADFINPLMRMALIKHERLGSYSAVDFDRFAKEGAKAEGHGMFMAMLEASDEDILPKLLEQIDGLKSAIQRTDKIMTDNAEGDTATNFAPLYEELDKMRAAVATQVPGEPEPVAEAESGEAGGGRTRGGVAVSAPGSISSRDDVIRALDAISEYYAKNEPSSPVPFALRRAREWISLDFMAVLEDIAPGSVDEALRVLKSGRNGGGGDTSWSSDDASDDSYSSGGDDSGGASDEW
jgi:type VI secretion system protein ImpA